LLLHPESGQTDGMSAPGNQPLSFYGDGGAKEWQQKLFLLVIIVVTDVEASGFMAGYLHFGLGLGDLKGRLIRLVKMESSYG